MEAEAAMLGGGWGGPGVATKPLARKRVGPRSGSAQTLTACSGPRGSVGRRLFLRYGLLQQHELTWIFDSSAKAKMLPDPELYGALKVKQIIGDHRFRTLEHGLHIFWFMKSFYFWLQA